jgi:hypothetical protein
MGPLGGRIYTGHRKPHRVVALRIEYQDLAVEIPQHLGSRIRPLPLHPYKVIIY